MKRLFSFLLCLLCLCGCQDALGSFEEGTLDTKMLIQRINKEADEKDWDMMLFKENEDEEGLARYEIPADSVESCAIYTSVMDALPDEVAIFKTDDKQIDAVKEKVKIYMEKRKTDTSLLPAYKDVLDSYKEIEIGNYYIVIVSKEANNIVQFISESA